MLNKNSYFVAKFNWKFKIILREIITMSTYEFFKLANYKALAKSCRNLWNVNKESIYFIWLKFKNRKATLKRVKVSSAKYNGIFVMIVTTIQDLFSQTQNQVFFQFKRINKFQTLPWGFSILASPSQVFLT